MTTPFRQFREEHPELNNYDDPLLAGMLYKRFFEGKVDVDDWLQDVGLAHQREAVINILGLDRPGNPNITQRKKDAEQAFAELQMQAAKMVQTQDLEQEPTLSFDEQNVAAQEGAIAIESAMNRFGFNTASDSYLEEEPPAIQEIFAQIHSKEDLDEASKFVPRELLQPRSAQDEQMVTRIAYAMNNGSEKELAELKEEYVNSTLQLQNYDVQLRADAKRYKEEAATTKWEQVKRSFTAGTGNVASAFAEIWARNPLLDPKASEDLSRLAEGYYKAVQDPALAVDPEGFVEQALTITANTAPFMMVSTIPAIVGFPFEAAGYAIGTLGSFAVAAGVEGNNSYRVLREQMERDFIWMSEQEKKDAVKNARMKAAAVGVISGAIEVAGGGGNKYLRGAVIEKTMTKLGAVKNVTSRLFKSAIREGLEELGQEWTHMAGEGFPTSADGSIDWKATVDRSVQAWAAGTMLGFAFEASAGTAFAKAQELKVYQALKAKFPDASETNLRRATTAAMHGAREFQVRDVVAGREIRDRPNVAEVLKEVNEQKQKGDVDIRAIIFEKFLGKRSKAVDKQRQQARDVEAEKEEAPKLDPKYQPLIDFTMVQYNVSEDVAKMLVGRTLVALDEAATAGDLTSEDFDEKFPSMLEQMHRMFGPALQIRENIAKAEARPQTTPLKIDDKKPAAQNTTTVVDTKQVHVRFDPLRMATRKADGTVSGFALLNTGGVGQALSALRNLGSNLITGHMRVLYDLSLGLPLRLVIQGYNQAAFPLLKTVLDGLIAGGLMEDVSLNGVPLSQMDLAQFTDYVYTLKQFDASETKVKGSDFLTMLTPLGRETATRIVPVSDDQVADAIRHSRIELFWNASTTNKTVAENREDARAVNLYAINNPDASVAQIASVAYAHGFITGEEHALLQKAKEIFPENWFKIPVVIGEIEDAANAYYQGIAHPSTVGTMLQTLDVIRMFRTSDASVVFHELMHFISTRILAPEELQDLKRFYKRSKAYQEFLSTAESAHEHYRASFEEWLSEGFRYYVLGKLNAESSSLLTRIYARILDLANAIYTRLSHFASTSQDLSKYFDALISAHKTSPRNQSLESRAALDQIRAELETDWQQRFPTESASYNPDDYKDVFYSKRDSSNKKIGWFELLELADAGDEAAQRELKARMQEIPKDQRISKERAAKKKAAASAETATRLSQDQKLRARNSIVGKQELGQFTDSELEDYAKQLQILVNMQSDPEVALEALKEVTGASNAEIEKLLTAAGRDTRLANLVLRYRQDRGGYADGHRQLRSRQIERDAKKLREMQERDRRRRNDARAQRPSQNYISQLESFRYAMADLELRTGLPFYIVTESIEDLKTEAENRAHTIFVETMKQPGRHSKKSFDLFTVAVSDLQDPIINQALFEEDPAKRQAMYNQMTPEHKDVFDKMNQILQTASANAIRELRWWNWNRALLMAAEQTNPGLAAAWLKRAKMLMPQGIVDEDVERIIAEGREAQAQGRLPEWIAKQKFGTREAYFMSQGRTMDLADFALTPIEMEASSGKTAPVRPLDLRAAHSRAGTPEALLGVPVLHAVMYHLKRALITNAIKEKYGQLQELVQLSPMSSDDVHNMQQWINNIVGIPEYAGAPIKVAEAATRFFWRTFGLHLSAAAHYSVRNLLQPFFVLGHLSKPAVLKAGLKVLTGQGNEYLAKALKESWSFITQKMAMQREYMLLSEAAIPATLGVKGRMRAGALYFADLAGQIMLTMSDEIDRRIGFPLYHQAAYDAIADYLYGSRNLDKLRSNLYLDTLHPAQVDKLDELIARQDVEQFAYWFARYKTENTFFKYAQSSRSLFEQFRAGRLLSGLVTFPRGMVNQIYRNGLQPLKQGLVAKDVLTAWQGLATIGGVYVGLRIAQELARSIMGKRYRDDYHLIDTMFGYQPGSVGYHKILQLYDAMTASSGKIIQTHGYTSSAADKLADLAVREGLEWWFPFADLMVNTHEAINDTAGSSLWKMARSKLDERYQRLNNRKFRYDRDSIEKMQHILFGSEEFPHQDKAWKRMSEYEKFMRIAVGDIPTQKKR